MKNKLWMLPALAGGLLLAQALWLPAKAQLGQFLLERSWQKYHLTRIPVEPWPGADLSVIGKLEAPAHGVEQLLVAGQQGKNLAWAPGLVSAGRPGFSDTVVSAHRDSHFRFLKDVRAGDELVLTTNEGRFRYRVESLEVVDARSRQLRLAAPGDHLVLTTCYPFDALRSGGPLRYVVTATRRSQEQT